MRADGAGRFRIQRSSLRARWSGRTASSIRHWRFSRNILHTHSPWTLGPTSSRIFPPGRREEAKQLLRIIFRAGKWGINALYANFFTGLSTPEELFRMLEFSLEAGRKYGFPIDSASQTDEPSLTWALPQILTDAGIKYFTNGSDPIRGALNPIGHLNFHSPFYWEAPSGSKILVWSGISYTAVDDMTWAGWSPDSARDGDIRDFSVRADTVPATFSFSI